MRRQRRAFARACSEILEPRRLLSMTINASVGNDTINIFASGLNSTEVYVNGVQVADTTENPIFINGGLGNDVYNVTSEKLGGILVLTGGAGNDTYNIADGNFGDDIDGDIEVTEDQNDPGIDTINIADTNPGNDQHDTLHILNFQLFADETATVDATVSYPDGIEHMNINKSSQPDVVYVDSVPAFDTHLNLAGGNNVVNFGGSDNQLAANFPATMTITGGSANTDQVYFHDDGGSGPRTYPITSNSVMGETLSGIEQVTLYTNPGNSNHVSLTGIPATQGLNLNGKGELDIGANGSPVDLDNIIGTVNTNLTGSKVIWDQDANNSNQHFTFSRTDTNPVQILDKGTFSAFFKENMANNGTPVTVQLNCGSTNDVIDVAGMIPASVVTISGGSGNDTVQTVSAGGNNHDNDINDVFKGTSFNFTGLGGTGDYLDLDDSGNAVGDLDATYDINFNRLQLNSQTFITLDSSVDRVNLVADSAANQITFDPTSTQQFTVSGGAGNDLFIAGGPRVDSGATTVLGGSGTDQLVVDTSIAPDAAITSYAFAGLFPWSFLSWTWGPVQTIYYDNTLDQIQLTENTNGTATTVQSTSSLTTLTIDGNGGNDSFVVGGGDLDSNNMFHVTIAGGSGTDSIEFDDHLDSTTSGGGESETYNWAINSLVKGSVAISYGGFESQTLDAAGAGSFNAGSLVNVNALNIATTINGSTQSCAVNVAAGNLSTIQSTATGFFNINLGATVSDQVNINDNGNSNNNSYSLLPAYFWAFNTNTIFNMSNVDAVSINGSQGINGVLVYSTIPNVFVNCNNGDDYVAIGDGVLATDAPGGVEIDGGAGNDTVTIENYNDSTNRIQTLGNGFFTQGTGNYSWSTVEGITVAEGPGGETLSMNYLSLPTTVTDGGGPDSLIIGGGNLDTNQLINFSFDGGAGTDSVKFDDSNDTGNDTYNFTAPSNVNTFKKSNLSFSVAVSNVESETLEANKGNNVINVTAVNNLLLIVHGNAGTDSLVQAVGSVTFDGGTGLDTVDCNSDGAGSATTHFINTQDLATITARNGGTVIADRGSNLVVSETALSILSGGKMDLNDNDMILDYTGVTQVSSVLGYISAGRNGGTWNGATGLTSTAASAPPRMTALGTLEATNFKKFNGENATFDGVAIDNTAVLIKYTYYGDTNFNGRVDGADYSRVDFSFTQETGGTSISGWVNGDFDGNGRVDGGDYALMDSAFLSQGSIVLRPSAGAGWGATKLNAPPIGAGQLPRG